MRDKEQQRKYWKCYYEKNKERILKKNKKWLQDNREKATEISGKWKKNNRDRINERARERRCTKCKEVKPVIEFYAAKVMRDGLSSWCKECHRTNWMLTRHANPEKMREVSRRLRKRHRKKRNARRKAWGQENKEKVSAQNRVYQAILNGDLIRPDKCGECEGGPVQGHHDDYSKPLVVRWLCPIHHAKADKERKKGLALK